MASFAKNFAAASDRACPTCAERARDFMAIGLDGRAFAIVSRCVKWDPELRRTLEIYWRSEHRCELIRYEQLVVDDWWFVERGAFRRSYPISTAGVTLLDVRAPRPRSLSMTGGRTFVWIHDELAAPLAPRLAKFGPRRPIVDGAGRLLEVTRG